MRIEGSTEAFALPKIASSVQTEAAAATDRRVSAEPSSVEKMKVEHEKAAQTQEVRREMSEDEIFKQVKDANQKLKTYDRRLEFSIHDVTKKIMVKVINTNDDSVIREIPSEKALDMLAYVWKLTGILLDEKR